MILVDTSVWIQHFRENERTLARCLSDGLVLMHPFIAGELACGNLKSRAAVLADLYALPTAKSASNAEVQYFIEEKRLWGRGLGLVDIHLLASAMLSGCRFWALDKTLQEAAHRLGIANGAG